MAYINATLTQGASIARISQAVDAFIERRRKTRAFRDTLSGLQALSNRELADLGLHRSELRRVAREVSGI
ncbi:MAG: DUF1127 domain-containing protein [Pseudomonadota bacterium]